MIHINSKNLLYSLVMNNYGFLVSHRNRPLPRIKISIIILHVQISKLIAKFNILNNHTSLKTKRYANIAKQLTLSLKNSINTFIFNNYLHFKDNIYQKKKGSSPNCERLL